MRALSWSGLSNRDVGDAAVAVAVCLWADPRQAIVARLEQRMHDRRMSGDHRRTVDGAAGGT